MGSSYYNFATLTVGQDAQMFEFRMKARHFNDDSETLIGQIGHEHDQ